MPWILQKNEVNSLYELTEFALVGLAIKYFRRCQVQDEKALLGRDSVHLWKKLHLDDTSNDKTKNDSGNWYFENEIFWQWYCAESQGIRYDHYRMIVNISKQYYHLAAFLAYYISTAIYFNPSSCVPWRSHARTPKVAVLKRQQYIIMIILTHLQPGNLIPSPSFKDSGLNSKPMYIW